MALPSIAAAQSAIAVTPSDSTVLPPTRALYIGTGGNLYVKMANNYADAGSDVGTVAFMNVSAGILPIQVIQVMSVGTGTTASNILALY